MTSNPAQLQVCGVLGAPVVQASDGDFADIFEIGHLETIYTPGGKHLGAAARAAGEAWR